MYKVGDKLVCIKENCTVTSHKIGDIIQITKEPRYISSFISYMSSYLNKNATEMFFDDELHECFITLAEWREQLIKSVIDV
jgi:predicted glycosyltransferase involved in capsule biosynthesis